VSNVTVLDPVQVRSAIGGCERRRRATFPRESGSSAGRLDHSRM